MNTSRELLTKNVKTKLKDAEAKTLRANGLQTGSTSGPMYDANINPNNIYTSRHISYPQYRKGGFL